MSLVFKLQKNSGGFYCQIWKLMSNYLYAKKNNIQFYIDDSEWMFKHNLGWRDYFSSLTLITEHNVQHPIYSEIDIEDSRLHQFTLNEYIAALNEVYILNDYMNEKYDKHKKILPEKYNSIMIRRGDKMYGEAKYIETKKYIEKLLEKNNLDIFVQTDDYSAYEEVREYIKLHNENITVLTLCSPEKRGAFVFNYQPTVGSLVSVLNNNYLLGLSSKNQKSVNSYSPSEMKEHVEEMIIGLQLCTDSEYLATDFQSNVTRFLLCTHSNPSNVIAVGNIIAPSFDVPIMPPGKEF